MDLVLLTISLGIFLMFLRSFVMQMLSRLRTGNFMDLTSCCLVCDGNTTKQEIPVKRKYVRRNNIPKRKVNNGNK